MATPLPWDLVSSAYNAEVVPMFERYSRDALRLAAPPAGSRIVDVACGPGTLSFLAEAAGHPVDALDFSPEMLSYLQARQEREGSRITAQLGNGQALPYDDATFGAGFSMFGLMFFPDRAAGFRELRRVLVPGARAVVSSWTRFEENPILAALFGALRTAVAPLLPPNAPPPGSADMPLCTPELCKAEMSEAFADVEVHSIVHVQRSDSADTLWASLKRTMAPIVLMQRNLGDKFATIDTAVGAALRTAIGEGPVALDMPAWLSVGVAR